MESYDYIHRRGIRSISWEEFSSLVEKISDELYRDGCEVVVGIAKSGLFPATLISCRLRCELFPVRVTRRYNDQVVYRKPVWKVDVSKEVRDRRVAVVDEIADTGKTLSLVASRVRERGSKDIKTVSLVAHTWAEPIPDVVGVVTDELIVFPWDRKVLINGRWEINPEIKKAMKLQITRKRNRNR